MHSPTHTATSLIKWPVGYVSHQPGPSTGKPVPYAHTYVSKMSTKNSLQPHQWRSPSSQPTIFPAVLESPPSICLPQGTSHDASKDDFVIRLWGNSCKGAGLALRAAQSTVGLRPKWRVGESFSFSYRPFGTLALTFFRFITSLGSCDLLCLAKLLFTAW